MGRWVNHPIDAEEIEARGFAEDAWIEIEVRLAAMLDKEIEQCNLIKRLLLHDPEMSANDMISAAEAMRDRSWLLPEVPRIAAGSGEEVENVAQQ